MKHIGLTAVLLTAFCCGCAIQQPVATTPPAVAHPLPFKGKLIDGNPAELPPVVAMSLSNASRVTFSYREELTHDEHHTPMILSALNPLIYGGYPLGEYEVAAFATLSIFDGDRLIGDYTAQAHITKPYSLYSQPTHRELDAAARAAVRDEIDLLKHLEPKPMPVEPMRAVALALQ